MPASETKLLSARLPGATFGLSVELTRRWLSSLESVADGHPFLEIAQTYAVSLRFGIAEGPAVFRVLLRSAPPVGVSWRMAYTMETSRITIAYLLVEYSSSCFLTLPRNLQPQIFGYAIANFVGQLFQSTTSAKQRHIFDYRRRWCRDGDQQPQQHGEQEPAQRADFQQKRVAGMEVAYDAEGEKEDDHRG